MTQRKHTLITLTCDQPIGFGLCERYMARQTWPLERVQWIVVDDGEEPATPTLGQTYVRRVRRPGQVGAESFCLNLLSALPLVKGSHVAFIEHDDWYAPTYLEAAMAQFRASTIMVGDDEQRYFHVGRREWRTFNNIGACLCQTVIRRDQVGYFQRMVEICLARKAYGVDAQFWRSHPRAKWQINRSKTVVGIKGLPGRPGLGLGHRPDQKWNADPTCAQLQKWIGAADVAAYRALPVEQVARA